MSLRPAQDRIDQPRIDDQIDLLCDQYEAGIRAGQGPRIEDLFALVPEAARARLFREVLAVEFDLARSSGRPIVFEDYVERFPGYATLLKELRAEFESRSHMSASASSVCVTSMTDTVRERPTPPSQIRHFQLLSIVGEGAFGTVWRAFDTKLQRDVAVKIPRVDKFARVDISIFLQEARAAATLRHPNIVSVHEVGEGDEHGPAFIVTDFVNGPNLKQCIEKHQYTPRQIAELVGKVARALEQAHQRGIIHRDLKPANVLLDQAGEPHLADFGLAKRLMSEDPQSCEGQLIGTPIYMAPEQARGDQGAVDHRTDIYSLGVILYELLTGKPPFRGEITALLDQIQHAEPASPAKIRPGVPEDLENVCLRCLSKAPELRYQAAVELADDLRCFLDGELPRGVPVRFSRKAKRWVRRHRRLALGILAAVTACLCFSIGLWWWNLPPRRLVEFTTDPPGCEITVVRLDPITGDPDPDQIENAWGTTPLTMRLRPGDYLVVAVLNNERFHEVPRHVPDFGEHDVLTHTSRYWSTGKSGAIRFFGPIKIPKMDQQGLVYVEGQKNWNPSGGVRKDQGPLDVPPLLVDSIEHTATPGMPGSDPRLKRNDFLSAERYAESRGKRLPTGLELLYILHQQQDLGSRNTAGSSAIQGLLTNPWEWTTTKSGGAGMLGASRVLRCGTPSTVETDGDPLPGPIRLSEEANDSREFGVRCVRSVRPRRQRADFMLSPQRQDSPLSRAGP